MSIILGRMDHQVAVSTNFALGSLTSTITVVSVMVCPNQGLFGVNRVSLIGLVSAKIALLGLTGRHNTDLKCVAKQEISVDCLVSLEISANMIILFRA